MIAKILRGIQLFVMDWVLSWLFYLAEREAWREGDKQRKKDIRALQEARHGRRHAA